MKPQLIPACMLTVLACNGAFLVSLLPRSPAVRTVVATLLVLFCLALLVRPALRKQPDWQLSFLAGGGNLLLCAAAASVFTPLIYLVLLLLPASPIPFSLALWIPNTCLFFVLEATLLFHAMARLYAASARLRGGSRLPLLLLWWLPVANLALLLPIYRAVQEEWQAALLRRERDDARREAQICATNYPLFFIRGITIPDWAAQSYWGRIPEALKINGARLHYCESPPAMTVPERADALKGEILTLLAKESCKKVHIIAHGRGGLDARYAISRLGLGEVTASLTTINTPHRGCRFASETAEGMPRELALLYEHLFSHMSAGDPDFYSGLRGITPEACAALNEDMPDDPRVLYRSVGSKMSGSDSANFPLNLGFQIAEALDGENDGLVPLSSMPWGDFTLWEADVPGKWGISHGDVIDLSRKDIPDFDLCEHYVQLVAALKDRGL